jgi:hypothetical protein
MKEKTRTSLKVTLLFLSLLLAFVYTSSALAQVPGTFMPTGNMTAPRRGHTATLLGDGRVLIAGGWGVPENQGQSLASAEFYDPSTGKFMATGNMTATRRYHTATLLPDGRVLVAGGTYSGNSTLASAEVYDPSTGTFSPTGDMITARSGHMASLLPNGKVLIAAGLTSPGFPAFLASAELYDPDTGTFSATGNMSAPRWGWDAILLPDGRVFIFGVVTSELYDPGTGTFSLTAGLITVDDDCPDTQTLLANGKVLVAGGDSGCYGASAGANLYDPSSGTFTTTGSMNTARDSHTATLLPDGAVLIAGGQVYGATLTSAELYDPISGTFSATGGLVTPRCCHKATLLNDGRVLIAGGGFGGNLASAELYVPPLLVPVPVVTDLRFDRTTVTAGTSYSVNISGSNLTPQTFFDVRFIAPGSTLSGVVLNWQKGVAVGHSVLAGTASGIWTINGVRAHQIETDHTGSFVPVSATITVSP